MAKTSCGGEQLHVTTHITPRALLFHCTGLLSARIHMLCLLRVLCTNIRSVQLHPPMLCLTHQANCLLMASLGGSRRPQPLLEQRLTFAFDASGEAMVLPPKGCEPSYGRLLPDWIGLVKPSKDVQTEVVEGPYGARVCRGSMLGTWALSKPC